MTADKIKEYILNLPGTKLSHPYGKELAVYSVKDSMFAVIEVDKKPLRLSVRCDKLLADLLKSKYDEVMPGHKLNQDKWITAVLSGQLSPNDIEGLIDHSYKIASEEN